MNIKPAPDFFEPIRRTVLTSLLGYLPITNMWGAVATPKNNDDVENHDMQSDLPIVTYISRQGGGRRLSYADHEGLVRALSALEDEGVCRVNVVRMETMSVKEQVAVAARSTVSLLVLSSGRTRFMCGFTGVGGRSWKWTDGKHATDSYRRDCLIYVPLSIRCGCRLRHDPPCSRSSHRKVRPLPSLNLL